MIPKPAQYLLRFDDLCPTMRRGRWKEFLELVKIYDLHPILGIVPDNQDSELSSEPYDPGFWDQMRELEAAGAAVAVHGFQHICEGEGESLLGLHRHSEFAGISYPTQREWIRRGIDLLRAKGLNPKLWIGPRHGFDRNTLRALRKENIEYISDGMARVPFRRLGVTWVPQQLWAPMEKSAGLWTICIHPWGARRSEVERLRVFLEDYADQFTSFDRVVKEFPATELVLLERLYEKVALWRVQKRYSRARKRRRARSRQHAMQE